MLLVMDKSPEAARVADQAIRKTRREVPAYLKDLLDNKEEKAKRNKVRSGLYASMGLFLSLLIVVFAFNYKVYDRETVELLAINETLEEMLDIPVTEQPPPPPPKNAIQQPSIVEVPDEEEIIEDIQVDFDIDITADEAISESEYVEIGAPEEEKAEEIFTIVEQSPEPKMGMQGFMAYLYENIEYPTQALRLGVQGKVFVQFVVNSDGTLTDFEVIRGIGAGCDEEALRVLAAAEPWNPGKQRGKPVRVRMVLPIHFVFHDR